jgi:hypothetical protein
MAKVYNVWWLGGDLNKTDERARYNNLGRHLAFVFARIAIVNDHFRKHYRFRWHQRCTRKDFLTYWKSSETAGILWHSHGRPYPLKTGRTAAAVYNYDLVDADERKPAPKESSQLYLIPKELGECSPTLKLLALFHCHSRARALEWIEVTKSRVKILAANDALEAGDAFDKYCAQLNHWIWHASITTPDFRYAESWETYRSYLNRLKDWRGVLPRRKDPMVVSGADAFKSAWMFFKVLVHFGPAGPPPEKKEWIHCRLDRARIPGPTGRTDAELTAGASNRSAKIRGPMGRTGGIRRG